MRIGYLECFAGVSGDMLLGALVDAGVPRDLLARTAASLGVGAGLRFSTVDRSGISATKVDVMVDVPVDDSMADVSTDGEPPASAAESQEHPHRGDTQPDGPHQHDAGSGHKHGHSGHEHPHEGGHGDGHGHSHSHTGSHDGRGLVEIRRLILGANLDPAAAALALRAFELLAQAESKIHNVLPEQIHFHEVGAVDAIVDIVCGSVGLLSLEVDQWTCSPLNVGGGFVDCAHGRFPVPAPATAELLRGAPTYSSGIEMELVTPTGAALVRALGCSFASAPAMTVERIGYGAGSRDPKRFPNVLRLSIGDAAKDHVEDNVRGQIGARTGSGGSSFATNSFAAETIAVLECAVDDLSPQVLAHCAQMALDEGALDVMSSAVVMKKGRLGTLITLLCHRDAAEHFQRLLFRETSTLGIRVREEERVFLERKTVTVATQYGEVRVKIAASRGEHFHSQPEYEDCRRLAEQLDVPLKQVIAAAMAALTASKNPRADPAAHPATEVQV